MSERKQLKAETYPQILNEFLTHLKVEEYSKNTVFEYGVLIDLFIEFLQVNNEKVDMFDLLKQAKEKDVELFMLHEKEIRGNSSKTIKNKILAVHVFYKWFINKYNLEMENPIAKIKVRNEIKRKPKYLTLEQAKKLCNIFDNGRMAKRDNMILTLFLSTGLRVSEVSKINVNDINFEAQTLHIVAKGNKDRYIYLSNSTIKLLQDYITGEIDISKGKDQPLFTTIRKKRMSNETIRLVTKNAYKKLGIDTKGYAAHVLRHTFATIMYNETGDIYAVKEMLGHNHIQTTLIYATLLNDRLKNAYEQNPIYK